MRVLVTGAGGFLGKAIARALIARGEQVRSVSRGDYPDLASLGIEHFRGDLAERGVAHRAVMGCDAVIHVAALAGMWGAYERYHRANVSATEAILEACRAEGIRRLVYTSTPSVAYGPDDNIEGRDESIGYPARYDAPYPETKAIAEQRVLAANSPELMTVAIRPHLIWGPEDSNLVPKLVARARAGSLPQIGDGRNVVDTIYIENAAHAHLLALDALRAHDQAPAGRAYFVSDDAPVPAWEMINRILDAAGLPPIQRRIPVGLAYAAGTLIEGLWKALRREDEPRLTRFLVRNLSSSHWFDISAAKRDFAYRPLVSIDEGLERLRAWYESGAEAGRAG